MYFGMDVRIHTLESEEYAQAIEFLRARAAAGAAR